jgi:hypothetical protein
MPAPYAHAYAALWAFLCLVAAVLYIRRRDGMAPSHPAYWRFLAKPWKLTTFAVAATALAAVAPYTGDPTWDYVDVAFMSVLAFATAPWVVAALYRGTRARRPGAEMFVALCVGLFSASWSYDFYLLLRDGYYPVTWFANLLASSVLYLCGGLLWNLDWTPERGPGFAFTAERWPPGDSAATFRRVLGPALLLMGLVSGMILLLLWLAR